MIKKFFLNIKARQILTANGAPTVEVDFITDKNIFRSSCPIGSSTGENEVKFFLDNKISYKGKSVQNIIKKINSLKKYILENNFNTIKEFDLFIEDFNINYCNFTLPLSICFCKFISGLNNLKIYEFLLNKKQLKNDLKLPIPNFNVINGGLHSGNNFSCQEIMIMFNEKSFKKNLEASVLFFNELKNLIKKKYGNIYTNTALEGGYSPPINKIEEGLDLLREVKIISRLKNYKVALDFAANTYFNKDSKTYFFDHKKYDTQNLLKKYIEIINKYKEIYSIEDPFHELDKEGWQLITEKLGDKINIISDDLTVTNVNLIKNGIKNKYFNSVLIKPNQIGNVSKTIEAIKQAKKENCKIMISHRSQETNDDFIVHLAVGLEADFIKCGAPNRGERICKYNELLRIEENK